VNRGALEHAVVLHQRGTSDLAFWLFLGTRSAPVLELGAGTGRVMNHLIDRGVEAAGIEIDPDIRDEGLRQLGRLGVSDPEHHLRLGDIRDFSLGRLFALIIVPYNTFSLLDDDGVVAALCCARRHLKPDGTVYIEAQLWPSPTCMFPWSQQSDKVVLEVNGEPVAFVESASQTAVSEPLRVRRTFGLSDGSEAEQVFEMRIRTVGQWDVLMRRAGFERRGLAVDQQGSEANEQSRVVFFEAGVA
jgi:SAM-dependent methyltransferase